MAEDTKILATIENITAVQFYNEGKMDPLLTEIETEVLKHIPDTDTDKGRKEIASLAYKVSRSKTFLDTLGDNLVEDSRKIVKAVNENRKTMRDRLDALRDKARKPLTDWEKKEKEKAEAIEAKIQNIYSFSKIFDDNQTPLHSSVLIDNLRKLKGITIDESFGDQANKASIVKDGEIVILESRIEVKVKEEIDARELEELRKEKRERAEEKQKEKLRKEGEKRAKEAAEKQRQEEADRIQQEKTEADKRHKEELERIEKEKEAEIEQVRLEAEEKEKKRIADAKAAEIKKQYEKEQAEKEEEKRQKNKAHRKAINNNICSVLKEFNIDDQTSKKLITAIVKGYVPNMEIKY